MKLLLFILIILLIYAGNEMNDYFDKKNNYD